MSVLRLISLRSCRIAGPSRYQSEGIVSAPVSKQMLVHYNIVLRSWLIPYMRTVTMEDSRLGRYYNIK